ncbi:MAG: hypothetical protein MJZ61_02775 [Bacteroidales bacterium]|nr:hypothetical protein [Bacteroidales bacterium]
MKALKNIILGLAMASMLPIAAEAQTNCASFLSMRKPEVPYRYNTASKSAACFSGKKYEFVLPLAANNEYRIQFFASPVFNNDIQIKIVDMSTGETKYDLPGKVDSDPVKGQTCIQDYTDPKTKKLVHPYFDFSVPQATSLKIMIDIKDHLEYQEEQILDEYGFPTGEVKKTPIIPEGGIEQVKGCFTVYIADKPMDKGDTF